MLPVVHFLSNNNKSNALRIVSTKIGNNKNIPLRIVSKTGKWTKIYTIDSLISPLKGLGFSLIQGGGESYFDHFFHNKLISKR